MTDLRSQLLHPLPARPFSLAAEGLPDAVPVVISRDYSRLRALLRLPGPPAPVRDVLAEKLDRCRVVSPAAVPSSIAIPGACVLFAREGHAPESRILVMPEDRLQEGAALAISTPVGVAILGNMAGQLLETVEHDGRRVALRLLVVEHRHGIGRADRCRSDMRSAVTRPISARSQILRQAKMD